MNYLIDTHVFIWASKKTEILSPKTRRTLKKTSNGIFISPVSAFEIATKVRIGKMGEYAELSENYIRYIEGMGIETIPLTTEHMLNAGKLIWNHRDPFDRILASVATIENMTLITKDKAFKELKWLRTFW